MRVKSGDSGKNWANFPGGSLNIMVQFGCDQSRGVNHVCVVRDDVMKCVLIVINLKRSPLIIIYLL